MSPLQKGAAAAREWILPYFGSLIIGGIGAIGGANIAIAKMAADLVGIQTGVSEIKATIKDIQRDLRDNDIADAKQGEQITTLRDAQAVAAEQQLRVFERIRALEVNGQR